MAAAPALAYDRPMAPVSVTIRQTTTATPAQAFDTIIPVALETIFRGYGPLPAVTGVRDQVGEWDAAGDTRTVLLKGGGTMSEQLTRVERPGRCEYRVAPQDGPLKLIVDHIEGQFLFEPGPGGEGCVIAWTYAFFPKPGRRLPLLALAPLWRRYATQVMAAAAVLTEASHQ